ncbi:hypothetical protein IJT93_07840 [bacterium]|nr:hypothetical protein [bacterium]
MISSSGNSSLSEADFNIVRHNFSQGNTIGVISAFSQGEETNLADAAIPEAMLKEAARRLHLGFAKFSGRWTENEGSGANGGPLPECGYLIFGSPEESCCTSSVFKLLNAYNARYGPRRFLLIHDGEVLRFFSGGGKETYGAFDGSRETLQSLYTAFYRRSRFAKERANKNKLHFVLENIGGYSPIRPFCPSYADNLEYLRALRSLGNNAEDLLTHPETDSAKAMESEAKDASFGVIGAYRPENTPEENRRGREKLERDLHLILFDYDLIKGYCPDGDPQADDSFILYAYPQRRDELQNYLVSAVKEFRQNAALFVSEGEAFLLYGDGRRESLGAFSYGSPEALADMLGQAKRRPFRLGDPDSASAGDPDRWYVIKTVLTKPTSLAHAYGCESHKQHLLKYKENYFQTKYK